MTKTIVVNCAICNKKMKIPEDNMLYYNLDLEVDSICSDNCKVKYMEYLKKIYDINSVKHFKEKQDNQSCCIIC
jgi:hypothetical protein